MKELERLVVTAEAMRSNGIMSQCLEEEAGESYFSKGKFGSYIRKMDINTPIQMQQELEELWGNGDDIRELLKIVTVAGFKYRATKNVCVDNIKERIYNF